MEYRKLGRSGLKVSPLCLGAMMFGGPASEADSQRMIAAARDAGINFIDTADVYNGGKSEEVVGRAIRNERDRWVVATKLNGTMGEGPNQRGSSRKWIFEAARRSLARLGTDYIDIYYLHREDLETPLEESVHALADLVRAGMIRYFALSNHKAWRIAEICNICDRIGIDRPIATQPLYNALNRMAEVEQFPAAAYYGLGVVPYSPLARGVLSGKYAPGAAAAGRQPRGAQRSAHDADRVAAGVAGDRPEAQDPRRGARHDRQPVRHGLGAGEPPGHLGDLRAAHRSPTRGLCRRAWPQAARRLRGPGRQPGGSRTSVDARLPRPDGAAGRQGVARLTVVSRLPVNVCLRGNRET